jgi:hypothetical protein
LPAHEGRSTRSPACFRCGGVYSAAVKERDVNFDLRSGLEPYRVWLEATRSWGEGALGSQRVLARAVRRSAAETQAVLEAAAYAGGGTPDPVKLARLANLSRAR